MKIKIYLDDDRIYRNPEDDTWTRVYNYNEFVNQIKENGLPKIISFDHDLSEEKTGKDCANFLVDYCIDNDLDLPEYKVHSANPVGKENILGLLDNYKKFRNGNGY